jgi:hypothetical protein
MRLRPLGSLLVFSLICVTTASTCESDATEPQLWRLTLSTAGSGSGTTAASPAPTADGDYLDGSSVTITATAAAGSDFTGWNDGDAEAKGCSEPKNPCTLTMTNRRSVIANFAPSSGVARYDGLYTGTYAVPNISGVQTFNLTVVNGAVVAKTVPLYGSQTTFTGTISATGAFTATLNPQAGSFCATNLTGTITTSLVDGIMTATLSGNYQVVSTGGIGCGASPPGTPLPSGTWAGTRDRVHVDKI